MKKVLDLLFSFRVAGLLLLIFAFAIGGATFIENDYGTETAWAVVYGARWFEAVMVLLALNLLGNIVRYRMWERESLPAFVFHAAMLLILVGAGLTRYLGSEGSMHIRAGETENRILSASSYLQVDTPAGHWEEPVRFSSMGTDTWQREAAVGGKTFGLSLVRYICDAQKTLREGPGGLPAIHLIVSEGAAPSDVILVRGQTYETGTTLFSFDANVSTSPKQLVRFGFADGNFTVASGQEITYLSMATQKTGALAKGAAAPFTGGRLYTVGSVNFVPKEMTAQGIADIVPVEKQGKKPSRMGGGMAALELEVTSGGQKQRVIVTGGKGALGDPVVVTVGGEKLAVSYGSKIIALPFGLRLDKFTMDRYPGSMSPSSYQSDVTVVEGGKAVIPYRIYMNHVLDHGGYRFFQSSYDADELGTILSVSRDPGKIPTYIGYALLGLGLFGSLFNPRSRFRRLGAELRSGTTAVAVLIVLACAVPSVHAAQSAQEAQAAVATLKKYDPAAAKQFGELLVQDQQGRIKPLDTLAIEVLNKVSKTTSLLDLSPDQVIMGMVTRPKLWQDITMIKISHPELVRLLGLPSGTTMAAFNDFFDYTKEEPYRLKEMVEEANRKRPALRDKLDNEIIKVDERVNICYMIYTGDLLRLFPRPADATQTWYSPTDAIAKFPTRESQVIRLILTNYFVTVDKALDGQGNWADVLKGGELIAQYQKAYGKEVIPAQGKIDAELLYNKANIFGNLIFVYMGAGMLLLGFAFAAILKPGINLRWPTRITFSLLVAGFAAHTAGLALRWYISGHAPWSDGYESMIYIAWATILAGFFFSRYSAIAMASTGVLGALTLFVAHMGWMDPQVTNLVPVLKSYWLNIHVSMITASYGFLALGALLGFFTLILFILRRPSRPHLDKAIADLIKIDEMTLIVGLSMLTLGNFLGGVWANESWGRYWGWDPKETWALTSILIYAFVTHMRFIPGLKSPFAFTVASLLAFSSVIMTYFGVNFYLSGLHSYAAGDPVPVPTFVYYTIVTVTLVILLAFPKRKLG